jgi:membrane-bound lytic murein transglycosylase A
VPVTPVAVATVSAPAPIPATLLASPGEVRLHAKSRWQAVPWSALPGWDQDRLPEAWAAWLRNCERPGPALTPVCPEVRQLAQADPQVQADWFMRRFQPYRVESLQGAGEGLLTGYFEPSLEATRRPVAGFSVPLYRPPATLAQRKPWYTRQEMDSLPDARAALAGREILWLADPVDALVLQIQGSGRVRVTEADGSQRQVRLAYAGTNDQPYKSVGRWLMDQGAIREGSWPTIRAWIAQNPAQVQALLWSNPRVVFFKEEALGADESVGPRGAQGVPLTAGRSIAVDPQSIPYGTPVWLATPGPLLPLQKLVFAQDTGSAITGAVRADYFVGAGAEAGATAGRLKQPLQLWALWPRQSSP